MTSTTLPTRRKALKLFAGVPLLPLGASGAAAFLSLIHISEPTRPY